jgi:hypothetical protein
MCVKQMYLLLFVQFSQTSFKLLREVVIGSCLSSWPINSSKELVEVFKLATRGLSEQHLGVLRIFFCQGSELVKQVLVFLFEECETL